MKENANFFVVEKEIKHYRPEAHERASIRKRFKLPSTLGIEPISFCTFDCEFCMIRELKTYKYRAKPQLSAEDFGKIALNTASFIENIEFSGGEPLMNKDIFKMFCIAKKFSIETCLASNSSLLIHNDNYKKILDSPPDNILFSFEADKPDEYAKTRRKADYDKIVNGLELFFNEREKRNIKNITVTLQTVVTKRNFMNSDEYIEKCKHLGAEFASFKSLGIWPESSEKSEQHVVSELLPDFDKCKLVRYYVENGKIQWEKMGNSCNGAYNHAYIGSGGEIYPCYYIVTRHKNFGNALETSFISAWRKPENQDYLQRMSTGKCLPECKKCLGRYREGAIPSIRIPLK